MGVCYSIVRDDIGQRFELGKGKWDAIFQHESSAMVLPQDVLAEQIAAIGPEAPSQEAARRILKWAGGASVRLITDDIEERDWDRCLETGSIWKD